MRSQNTGNIVSDLAPALDQAIMLSNTDILSMGHCKQIHWHLNETTTISLKKVQNIVCKVLAILLGSHRLVIGKDRK